MAAFRRGVGLAEACGDEGDRRADDHAPGTGRGAGTAADRVPEGPADQS
jgi:hypothetical protein